MFVKQQERIVWAFSWVAERVRLTVERRVNEGLNALSKPCCRRESLSQHPLRRPSSVVPSKNTGDVCKIRGNSGVPTY